jgi:prolyl-tRNA editing enzyme YbaK/EbsC (Cys-tRNA(Pro) deacylase)
MGLRKIIEKLDTVVLNLDEKGLLAVLKADEEINIKDMADLISKSLLSGL